MHSTYFQVSEKLGIRLPAFPKPFEQMAPSEQEAIVVEWERIRAQIPDRIATFESDIRRLLDDISGTEDWDRIVRHFNDISDIASRIAELNTWKRVDPVLTHGQSDD